MTAVNLDLFPAVFKTSMPLAIKIT